MASNTNNIPRNAVQILFAEDLVNRVLFRHNGIPYTPRRAGPYRDFILNAFNEEIQKAVDYIDMILEMEIDQEFSQLLDIYNVDENAFVRYAIHYGFSYFPEGFDPRNFLFYCVRLVSIAAYFAQFNVRSAPDMALYFILKALEGYDMFEGGWDTLNNVAKIYVKANEDYFNILTPDSSDTESLADGSDEEADQSEENLVNGYFINREDGLVNNQLEISKEEPDYETDDLPSSKEGLDSTESTESKKDSKSELSSERRMSSDEKSLNVVEAPAMSSTPNREENDLESINASISDVPHVPGNSIKSMSNP